MGRRGAREEGAGEGARGEAGGGAEGGAGRRGGGHRRAQKRARAEEAQGLVRAVRVVGLGDVKVRVREGEVLRLRHVLGGACGESVRTQRMRFSRRHTFGSLGSQGNNNIVGGGEVDESDSWDVRGSVSADAGDEGAEVRDDEVRRIEREGLEARLGRGGYVVGAMWDEGNMVHAMRRFGGTTLEWRFGDG